MPTQKKISKVDQLRPKKTKQTSAQSKSNTQKEEALLQKARERSRDGATFWKKNWEAAVDDLKFLDGKQWPSEIQTERELEQRPCLTNNVLPTFVDQVLGDQRQNRPSIKISGVEQAHVDSREEGGGKEELRISNRTMDKDYSLAEVFTGIIRNIEYNCDAETAYDLAFQAACESGMGYLRVLTDYVNDEGFEQEILIKHIDNQFSVTFDPGAKERDRSDAAWCFIDDYMLKEEFTEKYPDAEAEPISDSSIADSGVWFSDKTVKLSEYIVREPIIKEAALLSDGRFVYMDELEPIVDELMEEGITIEKTRNVKTFKVVWRKISGLNVLEGPIELNCTTIPVVPVWGKSLTIKKETTYRSIIRHSKDAQRMANYWDSAATEAVALAPKAPFTGTEGHIEGYEDEWKNSNTSNQGMLPYVPQYSGDPGPQRQQASMVPAAEITLGMNSTDKIKSTLGMFDASIGAKGNETSGKAILARQKEADVGSFVFIDNLSKAIRRVGKILIELIPQIYDTERVMRLKFQDETEDYVTINQQVFDEESGKWVTIHDLNVIKYDVVVKTGPAYTTQRVEAAEAMLQFAQAVPSAAAAMADLIAQNMDWPGADDIAERLKKVAPSNMLSKKEREEIAKDMPEQEEPTPEQQIQMQELEARKAEAEAKGIKAKEETVQQELQTEEARLKLAAIEEGAQEGEKNYQNVKELIAQALAEIIPNLMPGKKV